MTAEQLVIDFLIDLDATAGRVYPSHLPDDADYPAVTVAATPAPVAFTHQGRLGLQQWNGQLSCWGETYDDAKTLQRAILDGIDGLRDGVNVQAVFPSVGPDLYDSDAKMYHHVIDLTLWHVDPLPDGS